MLGVLTETLLTESLMEDAVVDPVEPGRTRGTRGGLGVASWSDLRTCGGVVGGDRRIMLRAGCSPREGGGGGAASSSDSLRSAWRWPWSAPSAAAGAPYGEAMAALQSDRGRPFPSQLPAFPRESPDVTAVERDAAKLGQPCAAVAGRPSKNSLPLRGRRNAARAKMSGTCSISKKVKVRVCAFFSEHSRRAPGRRTRGPATAPSFRPLLGLVEANGAV